MRVLSGNGCVDRETADSGQNGRDPVDVGGDGVEDQGSQPREQHQRTDREKVEHRSGDERDDQHRPGAAAPAFDDAGQPTDIGAVADRQQAAQARDQERDQTGTDRSGDQHPKPIAVSQQPHRDGPQQRQRSGERHDDRDDRGRRAQRGHHRCLRELAGTQRAGLGNPGRRASRVHFNNSASTHGVYPRANNEGSIELTRLKLPGSWPR